MVEASDGHRALTMARTTRVGAARMAGSSAEPDPTTQLSNKRVTAGPKLDSAALAAPAEASAVSRTPNNAMSIWPAEGGGAYRIKYTSVERCVRCVELCT